MIPEFNSVRVISRAVCAVEIHSNQTMFAWTPIVARVAGLTYMRCVEGQISRTMLSSSGRTCFWFTANKLFVN